MSGSEVSEKSLAERKVEVADVLTRYPDRVPVICQRRTNSDMPLLSKTKYLVPSEFTPAQFLFVVRRRLTLPSDTAVFLFVNGTIPASSMTFRQLYEEQKSEDGYLYIVYSEESVFG